MNVRVSVQMSSSVSSALTESDTSQESHTIRVKYDERTLAERAVRLAASDVKVIVFEDLVLPPGDSSFITVSVAETDALLADNMVSTVVQEANPVSVSLVDSDAGTSINAAVFLSTALETDTLASVSTINGSAERVASDVAHIISGRNIHGSELDNDVLLYVEKGNNALLFSSVPSSGAGASLVQGAEVGLIDESHPLDLGAIDWFGIEFYDVTPMSLKPDDKVFVEDVLKAVKEEKHRRMELVYDSITNSIEKMAERLHNRLIESNEQDQTVRRLDVKPVKKKRVNNF